jgi:hypothetical protein
MIRIVEGPSQGEANKHFTLNVKSVEKDSESSSDDDLDRANHNDFTDLELLNLLTQNRVVLSKKHDVKMLARSQIDGVSAKAWRDRSCIKA